MFSSTSDDTSSLHVSAQSRRASAVLMAAFMVASFFTVVPARPVLADPAGTALQFNGTSQYVTFGAAPSLGLTTFTLEAWVKRTGAGVATTTGTGGITNAIPLITKGRGEAETPANLNANYFLGIDATSGKLVADFEDTVNGGNHPVTGTAVLPTGSWHHVAVTYAAPNWNIYLDGVLDKTLSIGAFTPESTSIQHAGLATAMTSTGVAAGFFAGVIDEARIWNVARSQTDIAASMYQQLTSGSGLVARWGLNEGSGTTATDSIGAVNGTWTAGPTWVAGFPDNVAPAAPSGLAAANGVGQVGLTWTPSGASDLAGYNVYRGTASPVTKGTPLNGGTLVTNALYADTTGTAGTPYFYAVSAVDTGGNESGLSNEATGTPQLPPPGAYGLDLGSSGAYVTFGDPAKLDLSTFTIETWFKRTGAGVSGTTGNGGIANLVPLVTHGGPENDGSNVDANWILGINTTGNVLAFDYEDMATGGNHPVSGTTPIATGTWYHAAVTYDGTAVRLYLNGALDATLASTAAPRSDTIQKAGLGVMLKSDGTPGNTARFQGVLDETRVWNVARTLTQIDSNINDELTTGSGLAARWGFSEGFGTAIGDSIATAATGTLTGTGASWVAGAPFNIAFDTTPPAAPAGVTAATGSGLVTLTWTRNGEPDLAGYNVYRGTSPGVPTTGIPLNGGTALTVPFYTDHGAANGTPYYYVVTAVDTSANKSPASTEVTATPSSTDSCALNFNGSSQYVTMGTATDLDAATFTLETWFYWTGGGVTANTGSGGIDAIPLVTKGLHEAEGSNVDANYVLGIAGGKLAADFEDMATGGNHPVTGVATISPYAWHHAAATYDGQVWKLYLDGTLDRTLDLGSAIAPRSDSIQHAGLGTAMNSTGVHEGYFAGFLDEARIWNVARSAADIQASMGQALATGSGLIGRFGLDECTGTVVANSIAGNSSGTASPTGTPPEWVAGKTLTVPSTNHVPLVTNPGDQANAEGDSVSLPIVASDPDNDTLSYGAVGLPTGLAINTATGVISGTVSFAAAASSPYHVTVTVSDGQGGSTPVAFDWTISNVNQAPVVPNPGTQASAEGAVVSLSVIASDPDNDPLNYGATGLPTGLAIGPTTGLISGAIAFGAATGSPYHVTVTVTDGPGGSTPVAFDWTISHTNQAPVVTNPGDQATPEGTPVSLPVVASDPDTDTLTYGASGLPAALAISPATGLISGTVSYDAAAGSPYHVTVTVTDGQGGSTPVAFDWTISNVDRVPVAVADAYTLPEDATLLVDAPGVLANDSDADGDSLTALWVTDPTHGTLTLNADGSFSYTPTPLYHGPDSFTYKAHDGTFDSSVVTVSLTVTPVNHVPLVTNPGTQASAEGAVVSLPLVASDPDNDTLTYGAVGLPTGLAISSTTGLVSGTVSFGAATGSPYHVTVTVTDGQGGSTPVAFDWTISPDTTKPVITVPADYDLEATGPTTPVTYSVTATDPVGIASIVCLPASGAGFPVGTTLVDCTATDRAGNSDTASFMVTVEDTTPPVISGMPSDMGLLATGPDGAVATWLDPTASDLVDGAVPVTCAPASGTTFPIGQVLVTCSASDAHGNAAIPQSFTVTVSASAQTITFDPLPGVRLDQGPIDLSATATSGLPVTFSTTTPTVCTVVGTTLSLHATGSCTVIADQAGDATYAPAPSVPRTFLVAKGNQATTFGTLPDRSLADSPVTVAATASSGLAVSFSSSTPAVCSVVGATVTLLAAGACTVRANQAGNADWNPATQVSQTFTVNKNAQTITFGSLGSRRLDQSPVVLTATASSGLSVTFSTNTAAVCTVTATSLTLKTTGICQVQADQAGNATFAAAPPVLRTFAVTQGDQTISFGPLAGKALADPPFTVSATASSGLPVSFSSTTPAVCGVAADTVTILAAGLCTIQASQGGDTDWNAAASVSQGFTVEPTNHVPVAVADAYTTPEDGTLTVAAPGVLANDTDADGDSLSAVTVTDPTHGTLTLNANGSFTYTPTPLYHGPDAFTYKANDGVFDSSVVGVSLTVSPVNHAPLVTDPGTQASAEGAVVSLPLVASDPDSDPLTYGATGLPTGLSNSSTTGLISGTVAFGAATGSPYHVTVTVTDGQGGSTPVGFDWTISHVNRAPVATADSHSTSRNEPLAIAAPGVLANDSDLDGDVLSAIKVSDPAHGTLTLNGNGSFTYVPAFNYGGADSFTYKANDGALDSNVVTVALTVTAATQGYWMVASDGGIFTFGNAGFHGSMGGHPLDQPIVGMAPTPSGLGYWMVASDGGIFAFGDAPFYGSMGGHPLDKPIVGMAATRSGHGYWLVASDGGIFAFGDALFKGSKGGQPLDQPIVGMTATPSGLGYWLVASDGGIFAFGDAVFHGSKGGQRLDKPIVGMTATASGNGYWLVASDGGIFTFGDALFYGSKGGQPLDKPIVGMTVTPSGHGYWLVASDGGIFTFGDAIFYGSMGGRLLDKPIDGMAGH